MEFRGRKFIKMSSALLKLIHQDFTGEAQDFDYVGFCELTHPYFLNCGDDVMKYAYGEVAGNHLPIGKLKKAGRVLEKYLEVAPASIEVLRRILYPDRSYAYCGIYTYLEWVFGNPLPITIREKYTQLNTFDTRSVAERYSLDPDSANKVVEARKKQVNQSRRSFIERYGESEGIIRFNSFREKSLQTKENFVKRHGVELGEQKYIDHCSKKSYGISKEGLTAKYGYQKANLLCSSRGKTKEQIISKYGQDYYLDLMKRRTATNTPRTRASKSSAKYLLPMYKALRKAGVTKEDIFWGIGNSTEFRIGKFFYDFTIFSHKIIIEYNGVAWHPKSTTQVWKHPFGTLTTSEKYHYDRNKLKVAESQGFTVIEVWDDELPDQKVLLETILENFKN